MRKKLEPPYIKSNSESDFSSISELLSKLIKTPSFSKQEEGTTDLIASYLESYNIQFSRVKNNIISRNLEFSTDKPTLLLNSHHDTVKPNDGYTFDPFSGEIKSDRILGLGSNDAGGALVSLISVFIELYGKENLPFNVVFIASAEEEISGKDGIEKVLNSLKDVQFKYGIVGEPTKNQIAIAEKGLMVADFTVKGKSGHAARKTGINAIYKALDIVDEIRKLELPKISETLGSVNFAVTQIEAGYQHNVIPDKCKFTVDIRSTDAYSNVEILKILRDKFNCEIIPRSTRLNSSGLLNSSLLLKAVDNSEFTQFGSPTLSDQALIPFDTIKMGPGDSDRSHSPDEYILIEELKEGINGYIAIINKLIESEFFNYGKTVE